MLHAVIMAGGTGTRFWPQSRTATPKQVLSLVGDRSMLELTVNRLGCLVTSDRTWILTNTSLVEPIRKMLPQLPFEAFVGEPCKRDTAPCIGLAASIVSRNDPEATMAVMPADHVIRPATVFQQSIQLAATLTVEQPRRLVTFGIKPTYAAESFGYIERGLRLNTSAEQAPAVFSVARFREKPDARTAARYVASGNFLWNSGIFVWKAATILEALAQFEPQLYGHLMEIAAAWNTSRWETVLAREFAAMEGISIDYAVMERAHDVAVIEAPFTWDDVGSWQSLTRLEGADADGNTMAGKCLSLRTSGTIVRGNEDHLVVTLGLKDALVVHTPDATLVANKHDEESIRKVVKLLEERGWKEYL